MTKKQSPPCTIEAEIADAAPRAVAKKRSPGDYVLDDIDRAILRELQTDGRQQNIQLAIKLKMPPSSIHKRFRRLLETQHIQGVHAVLNPEKFRESLLVFAKVRLDAKHPRGLESFKAKVQLHSGVLECHVLDSGFECLLKVRVATMNDYRLLISRLIEQGVCSVHSQMVMEEIKRVRGFDF